MAEHTGGHHLDTGDGPQPLTLAAGNAYEGVAQAAYRAYIEHRPACDDCREGSAFQCADAAELWNAYKALRA